MHVGNYNISLIKTSSPLAILPSQYGKRLRLGLSSFLFVIFFIFLSIPIKSFSENKDPEPAIETDEVIIWLNVKNLGTCEIPAAIRGQDIYLPVVDVFNFLKIRTIPGTGFDEISGFFIDPKNTYQIDRANHLIIYQGKTYTLKRTDIIVTETNLYLKSKYFEQIFNLECKFNYRALTITLKSALELPAIREMRLEQMHFNLNRLRGEMKADTTIARTYPLLHFGMADWSLSANQLVNGKSNARLNLGLGAILAGGELNSLLLYNANQPFLEKQQYYLWRYANNENKVLKQLLLGKIATQSVSTIFNPVVGIQFTNAPTVNRKSFGTYTLNNYTTPNWTVELYVNGILIDYVKADAAGFFSFDVPLIYGSTDVTLRYYGPWGEELSSKQSFNIPFNFLPPKELEYKISSGIIEDDKNSLFGQARMNYGVARAITIGGGLEYNSSIATNKNIMFLNTSIRLAPNMLFNGEYDYGIRYKGLLTYHLPSNLQLELYYSKYNPDQQTIKLNYTEERRVMVSQPFHFLTISGLSRLSFTQNLIQQPNSDLAPTKYSIPEFSLSGASHGISVNITTSAYILDKINTSIFSDASLSATLPGGILFTPQIRFDYKLNQISLVRYSLEKRFVKYGVINASYQNNLTYNSPVYQVGFRYDLPYARVGVSAMQSNNTNSLSEFASGSLIVQPQVNYHDFNVNANVGRGGLIFIPFLDINNNGKKDKNEPKVSGLNVMVSGGGIQKNRKDTTIAISGLEPYTNYFVEVDANSFENMAWKIIKPKMNIAIEPNKLKLIEIPISIVGEASGTVYIKKGYEEKGLGRIVVCFYTDDSVLVSKVLTESDGYFNFLGLLPGSYYAKIDPEQLNKLQMSSSPSTLPIDIKGTINGDVVDGLKFTLQYKMKGQAEFAKYDAISKQPEVALISPPQISDSLKMLLSLMVKKQSDSLKLAYKKDTSKVTPAAISENPIINKQRDFAVQVRATSQLLTAQIAQSKLNKIYKQPIVIVNEGGTYKVRITGFNNLEAAKAELPKVEGLGFAGAYVISPAAISENHVTNKQGNFAVQVRATNQLLNAQIAQSKLSKIYKQPVVIVNEGGLYKVRITGFNNLEDAKAELPKIEGQGFAGAYVITPIQAKDIQNPDNKINSGIAENKSKEEINPPLSSSGVELTRLLYKQLIRKVEALLLNPNSTPADMLGLRNEVYSYLNSDLPDTSMQGMLQKYNAILSQHNSPHLFVKGTVIINSGASKNNYKGVSITVTDKETKQIFAIKPNPTTGKYLLILERNKKYIVTATNNGYKTYSEEISPAIKKDAFEINQEIRLKE